MIFFPAATKHKMKGRTMKKAILSMRNFKELSHIEKEFLAFYGELDTNNPYYDYYLQRQNINERIQEKLLKHEITLLAENTIKKELPKIITSELQKALVQK